MLILLSLEIVKIQNIFINPLDILQCIVTGNFKIMSDSRNHKTVSKCLKYRFSLYKNFDKCREEIASPLNDFTDRWCKREGVEDGALKIGTSRQ